MPRTRLSIHCGVCIVFLLTVLSFQHRLDACAPLPPQAVVIAGTDPNNNSTPNPDGEKGHTDPVNLQTGEYITSVTDVLIKGRVLDLAIVRSYRSDPNEGGLYTHDGSGSYSRREYGLVYDWSLPGSAYSIRGAASSMAYCRYFRPGMYTHTLTVRDDCPYALSDIDSDTVTIERNPYMSRFGYGWDFSFNKKVKAIDGGYLYFKGDGTPAIFELNDGIYKRKSSSDVLRHHIDGTFTIEQLNGTNLYFNDLGNITEITDRNGNTIAFGYGSDIHDANEPPLTLITDDLGREIVLSYYESGVYQGYLKKITDFAGREWKYEYNNDSLSKVTTPGTTEYPDGLTTQYLYDIAYNGAPKLTSIKDHEGRTWLSNTYTNGKVTSQEYGGETITIESDPNWTAVIDQEGFRIEYELNSWGQTTREIVYTGGLRDGEPNAYVTENEYTDEMLLSKTIYPEGNGIILNYDDNLNVTAIIWYSNDPNDPNLVASFEYEESYGFIRKITDPRENETTFTYDYEDEGYGTNVGNLMQITYPEVETDEGWQTPTIEYTYDGYGRVLTVTGPDGIVVEYEYYTDALNDDPNDYGHLKKIIVDSGTDPACLNIATELKYDALGRVREVLDPNDRSTKMTYNDLDQLIEIAAPAKDITRLTYNSDRKLGKIQRGYGYGWQEFEYSYNMLAKLTSITDSLGRTTTIGYDKNNNPNHVTDANNNTTNTGHDERRLVWWQQDAEGSVTTFDYDGNGRLRVITDAENASTLYGYDGYGRLETVTYADDSVESYGYDAAGNVTSFTNRAGEVITFEYDALNRLVEKQVDTQAGIVLTYDIGGRLVDVTRKGGSGMGFAYDRVGRLEETTDVYGHTVGYEYDKLGRRTKLVYPDDTYVTYEYDAAGRLEYIKDQGGYPIVYYEYDELSRATQVTYYYLGGFIGSMTYDYEDANSLADDNLGNRIVAIDYDFYRDTPHRIEYSYDKVGNVQTLDVGGGYDWTYGYDKTYQATYADQGYGTYRTVDLSYDGVYNRTYWGDSGIGSLTYSDNAMNQYTAVGAVTPTYDARGNITSGYGGGLTLGYDAENRLVSAGGVSYAYDLLGRRISRTSGGTTTVYVWDGAHVIAEYTNGSLARKYVYGPGMDNPVAMILPGDVRFYYFPDALVRSGCWCTTMGK